MAHKDDLKYCIGNQTMVVLWNCFTLGVQLNLVYMAIFVARSALGNWILKDPNRSKCAGNINDANIR